MEPAKPSLVLLFNHRLTRDQEADARVSLGIDRIVAPPDDLQQLWSQVPLEETIAGFD